MRVGLEGEQGQDVVEGLASAPAAFIGMLKGANFGKLVVKVS